MLLYTLFWRGLYYSDFQQCALSILTIFIYKSLAELLICRNIPSSFQVLQLLSLYLDYSYDILNDKLI